MSASLLGGRGPFFGSRSWAGKRVSYDGGKDCARNGVTDHVGVLGLGDDLVVQSEERRDGAESKAGSAVA